MHIEGATAVLNRLRVGDLLTGVRGRPEVDREAVARVVASVSQLAIELGAALEGLDVNPLIATPTGRTTRESST